MAIRLIETADTAVRLVRSYLGSKTDTIDGVPTIDKGSVGTQSIASAPKNQIVYLFTADSKAKILMFEVEM